MKAPPAFGPVLDNTTPARPADWAQRPAATPVIDSASLLQGGRELLIQHQGHCYRLQATRQGKLILTK